MVFHVFSQLMKQVVHPHRSETHISCNSTLKNTYWTSDRKEIWSNASFLKDVSEVLSEPNDDYLRDSDDGDDL